MKKQKPTLRGRGLLGVMVMTLLTGAAVQATPTFYESTVLNDHPLAFYPLDLTVDTSGIASDLTGNSNTGTYVNVYPPDQFGNENSVPGPTSFIPNAASFDGQTTQVNLDTGSNPTSMNFAGPITLEAWVQAANATIFGDVIAKGNDGANNNNEVEMRVNGNSGGNYTGGTYNNTSGSKGASGGVQTTNWTHVVVSNDGTNWYIYINGLRKQTNADSVGSLNWTAPWRIGTGSADGAGRFFQGNLAQVALYTNGLPASQVLAHYFAGVYGILPSNAPPIITAQPTPLITYLGGSATFSVGVLSALPTTNQWFSGAQPLVGQTNASLTLSNIQASGTYSVVVGNANGTTNSVSVSLTVKSLTLYDNAVLTDHPIAYYPIDNSIDSGTVATDVSGNGNNAVFINADDGFHNVTGPSPFITNAAAFNGHSYADMSTGGNASLLNFAGQITMEAWVQPANTSGNLRNILAKGYDGSLNYAEIVLRQDNGVYTGNGGSGGSAQSGVWAHVVSAFNGTNWTTYVNGTAVATGGDNTGAPLFSDPWHIGSGSADGQGRYFIGNITQVALYDHGLTAAQVFNHYFTGIYGNSPSNVAPIISTQPAAQSAYAMGAVQFSVAALSGSPISYQWFKDGNSLPGQSNSTLLVFNVQPSSAGNYSVRLTNVGGSTNSDSASLTISTYTPPTAGNSLEWSPNNNNGIWDNGVSSNWINLANSQPTAFNANDRALFDDAVGAPTSISLNDAVAPSTITNNSSANSYTIGGTGKITGSASLTKAGGSTLEISSANDFTGPVTVTGGVLKLDAPLSGAATTAGASNGAPISVASGSTLALNASGNYPQGDTGIIDARLIEIAGTGADGNGALQSVGIDIYHDAGGMFRNLLLTSDAKIGATGRADLGHFGALTTISTGGNNYNLTMSVGTYSIWREVVIDPNLGDITLQTGGNSWDFYGMGQTGLGNPANVLTVPAGCNLTFWHEAAGQDNGYAKIIHVLANGQWSYRPGGGPGDYHLDTVLQLEDGAGWNFYNGGGGTGSGVTFGGTITLNGITHLSTGDSPLRYTNVISGPGGFVWRDYNSVVTFTANDTYAGPTVLCDGRTLALSGNGAISQSSVIFFGGTDPMSLRLDVTGRSDATLTLANGQILGGIGLVNGSLTVSSGATVAPAGTNTTGGITAGSSSVGAITATNSINLLGTTVLKLNGPGTNDSLQAITGAINYGGTLNLVNISGTPLAAGNSFQLFNASSCVGTFGNIIPTTPGDNLTWDKSQLNIGKLSVVGPGGLPPHIGGVMKSGSNLILTVSGAANAGCYVVTSTNATAPLSTWTIVSTNTFDANGSLTVTNAISPTAPKQFYAIKNQ